MKKHRHKFIESKYKEYFLKYPRHRMRKNTLYKARKHPKQKKLKLKKWYRSQDSLVEKKN